MKKLSVYFDTSIINFHFAEDAPEKKAITIEYFERYVRTGTYDHFVSDFVVAELDRTSDNLMRKSLLDIIRLFPIQFLPAEPHDEIQQLATHYLQSGAIPKRKLDDALHVAI